MKTIRNRLLGIILLALTAALLCGCGSTAGEGGAEMLKFPNRVRVSADATQLELSKLKHDDVPAAAELLLRMTELKELDLGSDGAWTGETAGSPAGDAAAEPRAPEAARDLTWEDLQTLRKAAPQAALTYRFRLYGQDFTTADEEMDLSGIRFADAGAALSELLPLMDRCERVNLDSCGMPDEALAQLRAENPDRQVVWRVGWDDGSSEGFSCMTDVSSLDLTSLAHRNVKDAANMLQWLSQLETLDLGSDGAWTGDPPELTLATASVERPDEATRDLTWSDLRTLQDAAPQAQLLYRFRFFGRDFTTADEAMDLSHSPMTDNGATVKEVLPLMKRCTYLDMDSCGVPSEAMAEIRDAYPDMDVVWRIWFGGDGYSPQLTCRTDIELFVESSGKEPLQDYNTRELKYLTKVKRLDMGHYSGIKDWSFLSEMKDLEVCIITVCGWKDIEMLRGLTKLEYLEMCPPSHGWCENLDLSPLAELTNLEHLNICGISYTSNWEVLKDLTKLKRLWIGYWTALGLPDGAIEELREALPNTEINVTETAAAVGSWKGGWGVGGIYPERYALLREQMEYDKNWGFFPTPDEDPHYKAPWEK